MHILNSFAIICKEKYKHNYFQLSRKVKSNKILFVLSLWCVIVLCNTVSYAQMTKGDHEIAVSCGFGSFTEFWATFTDGSDYQAIETYSGPVFSMTYRIYLNHWFAVGITGSTQSFSYKSSNNDGITWGPNTTDKVYNAVLDMKGFHYNSRYRGMPIKTYTLIDIGYRYLTASSSGGYSFSQTVNSQWTPLGISVGDKISGFVEFGIGYKGLICGGLCYKIDKKISAEQLEHEENEKMEEEQEREDEYDEEQEIPRKRRISDW